MVLRYMTISLDDCSFSHGFEDWTGPANWTVNWPQNWFNLCSKIVFLKNCAKNGLWNRLVRS